MIDFEQIKSVIEFIAIIIAAILAWMNGKKIVRADESNYMQIVSQNGQMATIAAKVNTLQAQVAGIDTPPNTVVVTEPVPTSGAWSEAAIKARDAAIPGDAKIVSIADSPTYHIVQWTVKR